MLGWNWLDYKARATLPCIEYELTESEALHWLLQKHRRSNGLNAFSRILLALDLEAGFKEKARSNQQAGGQNKGSSKLTEAEKLDVRREIAAAAGVCVGNVSKVKRVTLTAHSELLQALRSGEISIHRASLWCKESPERQREELRLYQSERGIRKTIRLLVSRHRSKSLPGVPNLGNLAGPSLALEPKTGVGQRHNSAQEVPRRLSTDRSNTTAQDSGPTDRRDQGCDSRQASPCRSLPDRPLGYGVRNC